MEYYSPNCPEGHRTRTAEQTLITGRYGHVSALRANGRVLTAGGRDEKDVWLSSSELFDPQTGRVEPGTNMTNERFEAATAVLADSIYVCGGLGYGERPYSCGRFHSNSWTAISPMREVRSYFAMVAVNGNLFAIGGYNSTGASLSSVEQFDPMNNRWEFASPMRKGRDSVSAVVLNGYIYVCGALSESESPDCECYDPQTDQWETVAMMNQG